MYTRQLRSVTNQYINKYKIMVISDCVNAEGRHHEKAVKIKGENCQEKEKQPEEGGGHGQERKDSYSKRAHQ